VLWVCPVNAIDQCKDQLLWLRATSVWHESGDSGQQGRS